MLADWRRVAHGPTVTLPRTELSPLVRVARRLAIAVGLIAFTAVVCYLDRDGYVDAKGDDVSLLDAIYYSTVSVTTTGYGDIRPESDTARLLTTLLVTPARVLFLIVLVGTTLEVLAEGARSAYRVGRWRDRVRDHALICGFGTKGRSAAKSLLAHGHAAEQIVVVESSPTAREEATELGLTVVNGDASSADVLRAAGVERARSVVVAPNRDDTAVLVTLTARELNPGATIVASVREEENAHLLRQSGATSVIVSSGAAGRLLGLATQSPRLVDVLEDLLSVGDGLDLTERDVRPEEVGRPAVECADETPVVGVVRNGRVIPFDGDQAREVREGDRLVLLARRDGRVARPRIEEP